MSKQPLLIILSTLTWAGQALAQDDEETPARTPNYGVASECLAEFNETPTGELPEGYSDARQSAFLMNHGALSTSFSGAHGPLPTAPGAFSFGLTLNGMPALSCEERMAYGYTKTEDTNLTPVFPRLSISFTSSNLLRSGASMTSRERGQAPSRSSGGLARGLYGFGGFSFLPPLPVSVPTKERGVYSLSLAGELGMGVRLSSPGPNGEALVASARAHMSLTRVIGNFASAIEEDAAEYNDLLLTSSTGADLLIGRGFAPTVPVVQLVTPYLGVGWLNTTSFFWVGDDRNMQNNYYPYNGPTYAIGANALVRLDRAQGYRLRLGGEYFAAPFGAIFPLAGHPADGVPGARSLGARDRLAIAAEYGHLHTLRLTLNIERTAWSSDW